jgi:hypothetical protein
MQWQPFSGCHWVLVVMAENAFAAWKPFCPNISARVNPKQHIALNALHPYPKQGAISMPGMA